MHAPQILAVARDRQSAASCGCHLTALVLMLGGCCVTIAAGEDQERGVVWLDTLDAATRQARELRRPIFAKAGATWCVWCRRLEKELENEALTKELARWTTVHIDVDQAVADARTLGVGPIPALRILSPVGQIVATRDGYLPAEQLRTWLAEHYDAAVMAAADVPETGHPPDQDELKRLLRMLGHSDAAVREAAIRRLFRHPAPSAPSVVEAFAHGNLATRLAAMELLYDWKAPVARFDPWRPETITETGLGALAEWAAILANEAGATTGPDGATLGLLGSVEADLDALLAADSDAEVIAICERLVRLGRELLPTVCQRLRMSATDRERERLTYLRYRLVATDALLRDWPGGLERLAATSTDTRHRAAAQLAKRATRAESPLLLELFSDPDPLVREISLRALQSVGGEAATEALARLLHDPEPNVRAAVLKQLAESPSEQMIARVAEYVADENDPDLLVHAIRVFAASPGDAPLDALTGLLEHDSWRVRAEATETLGKAVGSSYRHSEERKADIYAALIRRLDDEDGFVVSRAINGLADIDLVAAVEPLTRAALRHPSIAGQALKLLTRPKLRDKSLPYLRQLCGHEDPGIRAAAIGALCQIAGGSLQDELLATLRDPEQRVRLAAAQALFDLLERRRYPTRADVTEPSAGSAILRQLFSLGRSPGGGRTDAAAAAGEEGRKKHPAWMSATVEPLLAMLAEPSPEAQLRGALPLVALEEDEQALPVLLTLAQEQASLRDQVARALPWLAQESRLELFDALTQDELDVHLLGSVADALARGRDDVSADLLWELVAAETTSEEVAISVLRSLQALYAGESFYDSDRIPSSAKTRIVEAARPRAESGPELQRLVALCLLTLADGNAAAETAEIVLEDEGAGDELQRDAFQVLLTSRPRREAERAAVDAVAGDNAALRTFALRYLARGLGDLYGLRDNRFYVNTSPRIRRVTLHGGQPIVPEAPADLSVEALRPLLDDSDAETVAYAGYFLALLGERDGIEPLLAYWRGPAGKEGAWRGLVYRAIAALNDDELTPILEEIYGSYGSDDYELREFYWTIRSIKGERILKLRKRIRSEVGMSRLR